MRMPDRQYRLAASHEEARHLLAQPISEATPSRRDFAQFVATQKTELAVVARLTGQMSPALVAHAQACDDAEVAAIAVRTEAGGLSVEDMQTIAEATSAPILRDFPSVAAAQIYYARLHGADAVVLPAAVGASALHDLARVATSLHMAAVVEVATAADLEGALSLPHAVIGLDCRTTSDELDLKQTLAIAAQIPPSRTLVVLPDIALVPPVEALRGRVDAVVAAEVLQVDDVSAVLQALRGA